MKSGGGCRRLQTRATIRITVFLEASSVTWSARAVLDFADEVSCRAPGWRRAEVSIAVFTPFRADHDNRLTCAIRPRGCALEAISQGHTFYFQVTRRLRTMLSTSRISFGRTRSNHTFLHGKCVCRDAPDGLHFIKPILQSHCESSAITNSTERK